MNRDDHMKELTKLGVQRDLLKEIQHRLDLAMVTSGIDTHEGEAGKVATLVLRVLQGMQNENQRSIDETSHQLKGRAHANLN